MNKPGGKGSNPRPFSVARKQFENNWDRVFKKEPPKTIRLINPLNNEEWLCEDYSKVQTIDGVEYVHVHKFNSERYFLMRKDALRRV